MATKPLSVFFCYAPQDEEICQALEAHLAMLERQGYITSFTHRSVGAGVSTRAEIDRQMDRADLIVILVSADLLASDHLYDVELRRALERQAKRAEEVLGVLVRPCDYNHGELAGLDVHPREGREPKALSAWPSRDDGLVRVAEEIRRRAGLYVGSLSLNPRSAHPAPAPLG